MSKPTVSDQPDHINLNRTAELVQTIRQQADAARSELAAAATLTRYALAHLDAALAADLVLRALVEPTEPVEL